jgi:hypothetical protein
MPRRTVRAGIAVRKVLISIAGRSPSGKAYDNTPVLKRKFHRKGAKARRMALGVPLHLCDLCAFALNCFLLEPDA